VPTTLLIDARAIQRELSARGFYSGAIDGVVGAQTREAVDKSIPGAWPTERKLVAVQQQIMAGLGIEVGEIDGLVGPQTLYAAEAYVHLVATGALPTWRDPLMVPRPDDARFPASVRTTWPRQAEVQKYFGPVGQNQTMLSLPFPMRIAWNKEKIVRKFSIHEKVHDSAKRVFDRIANAYPDEGQRRTLGLDLFGGCLNVRRMRGGSSYSMHSWGVAIDFDPERNQLHWGRDRAQLARPEYETFWRLWTEEGWLSLGKARNFDWQHVQAARL
jgi:hypothetical protein